jgi:hypothetical protein
MVLFGGQFLAFHGHWGVHYWWQLSVPHAGRCSHCFAGSRVASSLFRYRPQRIAVAKEAAFLDGRGRTRVHAVGSGKPFGLGDCVPRGSGWLAIFITSSATTRTRIAIELTPPFN